jgi:hypothetical protein
MSFFLSHVGFGCLPDLKEGYFNILLHPRRCIFASDQPIDTEQCVLRLRDGLAFGDLIHQPFPLLLKATADGVVRPPYGHFPLGNTEFLKVVGG